MKILISTKFSVGTRCFALVAGVFIVGASRLPASELDQIRTKVGTLYREVEVLDADRHGLLFRHARGIAKLPFGELSEDLQLLYEPADGVPEAVDAVDAVEGGFPGEHGAPPAKDGEATHAAASVPIHLVARVRWHISAGHGETQFPGAHGTASGWLPAPVCRFFPDAPVWRSHWLRRPLPPHADFHPTPANRDAALRGLLRATEAASPRWR